MRIGFGGFVPWIGHALRVLLVVIGIVLVEDPFGDVAVNVIKAPGIGLFLHHLLVFEIAVLIVPGVLGKLFRIIAEEVSGFSSGPAGVLPFGFRRQAIEFAGFGAKPLAIFIGGVVSHGDGGESFFAHAETHLGVGPGRMGDRVREIVGRLIHLFFGCAGALLLLR